MVELDPFGWWSMATLLGLWGHAEMERHETLGMKHIDIFKLINISKLAKLGWCVQTQTKCVLVRQVIQSVYCVPARRLKMCWMALLSLTNRWGT